MVCMNIFCFYLHYLEVHFLIFAFVVRICISYLQRIYLFEVCFIICICYQLDLCALSTSMDFVPRSYPMKENLATKEITAPSLPALYLLRAVKHCPGCGRHNVGPFLSANTTSLLSTGRERQCESRVKAEEDDEAEDGREVKREINRQEGHYI